MDHILIGLQATTYSANASFCANRALYFSYEELDLIKMRYRYGNAEQNFFNTTKLLKNISNTAFVCVDAVENFYIFSERRLSQFNSFVDYLTAFF